MSITKIWNLFIKFSHFPKDCKVAKLKPLYKNDTKTDPKDFLSSHSLQNYRKSDKRLNYELFNREQHSLQISIWVSQEPLNRHFSCIFDRQNTNRF